MKLCARENCNYPVFSSGYCRYHQSDRRDAKAMASREKHKEQKQKKRGAFGFFNTAKPRPKTKKEGSEKSLKELKQLLDIVFAKWVRGQDTHCFTCGSEGDGNINPIQCGHYIARSNEATRWHKDNARPQCKFCNEYNGGERELFRLYLCAFIGEKRVEELERLSKTSVKWTREEILGMIEKYK